MSRGICPMNIYWKGWWTAMAELGIASMLLDAKAMARFAADGVLVIPDLVPQAYNERVHRDEQDLPVEQQGYHFWQHSEAIREVFALPQVKGVIQSLVGPGATYDHSYLHTVAPGHHKTQCWHIDSGTMNPDPRHFDVQAFYFAHDTPLEMGPTLVLPGSHLRRATYWDISRYKNIVGQRHMVAKAGTIAFMHQDIWHCAQANQTEQTRYVFKIRLNPRGEQTAHFLLDGYDDPQVLDILRERTRWSGTEYAKDAWQKIKLWQYLTGDRHVGRRWKK